MATERKDVERNVTRPEALLVVGVESGRQACEEGQERLQELVAAARGAIEVHEVRGVGIVTVSEPGAFTRCARSRSRSSARDQKSRVPATISVRH